MSKMTQVVKEERAEKTMKRVENFMGGYSYEINPLDTLKMISASSIFGEPQYYVDGEFAERTSNKYSVDKLFSSFTVIPKEYEGKNTTDIMENAIDSALDYDFKATLEWAKTLRKDFFMRLNPQVIMVRAAMHPNRAKFNEENPKMFKEINMEVMSRADDVISQLTYYLYIHKSKNKIPTILKKCWAERLEKMTDYELYKYRNHGIGLIDTVRISHANNEKINELMKTGTVVIPEGKTTWENLKANGKSWVEILSQIKMNHMALLRNLRGIFTEIDDSLLAEKLMTELANGVEYGKQFPFRYMNAYNVIKRTEDINNQGILMDGLEKCLDVSCNNLPKLKGKSAFLSDNSGSAWDTFNSEFGTVRVAEIGNLSSVIGATNSEEGTVFAFGDRLNKYPISKRNGVLTQATAISTSARKEVGMSTENGIWIFLRDAIDKKEHWDNIFIYSDMQAGHGGLYGTSAGSDEYVKRGFSARGHYIDVAKLVAEYRKVVNPKVNVFCIQTAGYTNVLLPEYGYRTNIMYGWTGKELLFADAMIKFWDEKDNQK